MARHQAERAETATACDDMQAVYQIAKINHWNLKGKKSTDQNDGSMLSNGEDKLTKMNWALLGSLEWACTLHPSSGGRSLGTFSPSTLTGSWEEEVRKASKTLNNNGVPGMEGISAEIMTAGGDTVVELMWGLCNQVWESIEMYDKTGGMFLLSAIQ